MNGFDDRSKAFEAKFHLDKELAFKANARRDKLLGLWVAEKLGLTGPAADAYAKTVVDADLADPRHLTMLAKLMADLSAAGLAIAEADLTREMERLDGVAKTQILGEAGEGRQSVSPS